MISYYELLGMIKEDKTPDKIKVHLTNTPRIYKKEDDTEEYCYYVLEDEKEENDNYKYYLMESYMESMMFKKTIEILDEKKIPEKLEYWQGLNKVRNDCELDDLEYAIKYGNYNFKMFFNKINEILDYLNSKGE